MENRSPRSADARFESTAFRAFSLIWAVTTLVHQLAFTFWLETWQGWLLTFSAFLVILEPRCMVRFTTLIVTSLLNLWHKLPFVPNHILFEGFLNLTILLGLGWAVWTRRADLPPAGVLRREFLRRFWPFLLTAALKAVFLAATEAPRDPVLGGSTSALMLVGLGYALVRPPVELPGGTAFRTFAPVLRVELVIMYFWAVIQKLNWNYLDASVSCASELHLEIARILPFVPTDGWALQLAIWGSLAFEAGIPVLLLIPRLRFAGFAAAVFFHLWLSIHPAPGIYSFSSLIFAVLYTFLPRSRAEILHHQVRRWRDAGRSLLGGRVEPMQLLGWTAIVGFLGILVAQATLYVRMGRDLETFGIANRLGFAYWLAWGFVLAGVYLVAFWKGRGEALVWPNRPCWNPAWVAAFLVIWNGLNPWLGLKTQTSFSMYSNLRSEGFGNHVFLKRIDLFPFQNDLVELIEAVPPITKPSQRPTRIQNFANEGHIFPYFELRRMMSEHRGSVRVRYRRAGQEQVAWKIDEPGKEVRYAGDARLFEPQPWYLRKTLWFRRHKSFSRCMHCTH